MNIGTHERVYVKRNRISKKSYEFVTFSLHIALQGIHILLKPEEDRSTVKSSY